MKKIVYSIYIVVMITLLLCIKGNVITSSTGMVILFVIGLAELLYCTGSCFPTQTQKIETLRSMQDSLDRRNEPIQIKLLLFLLIPVILATMILQYL